ncbi:MAG: redoxin domain-containing protein [Rubripirellula sp.]|nr:redoxin domain-containing protein [Rubripirellula sp.]
MKNLLMAGCCFLLTTSILLAQERGNVAIGAKAPDFTVIGIDGKPLKLSELTGKGKHVVLLFDRAHW